MHWMFYVLYTKEINLRLKSVYNIIYYNIVLMRRQVVLRRNIKQLKKYWDMCVFLMGVWGISYYFLQSSSDDTRAEP